MNSSNKDFYYRFHFFLHLSSTVINLYYRKFMKLDSQLSPDGTSLVRPIERNEKRELRKKEMDG